MRSLSSSLTTEAAAEQSGWAELLDIYLKESLTLPGDFGTADVIRISNNGVDISFFTPQSAPEPAATQGDAATYRAWMFKRQVIKAGTKFANDKLALALSNVSAEFADLLDEIDWRGCAVVIRKTATTIASATADDCVTLFTGRIDSAKVTLAQVQFTCSSDFATFNDKLPRETMHESCRFKWADDQCTANRFALANLKPKTCGASSTTTRIMGSGLAGYSAQAVTADSTTDRITLTSHGLNYGHRVYLTASTMPGGLTAGRWYYLIGVTTHNFQLALTYGGAAVDITSNGTSVTLTSETGFIEDSAQKGYVAQAVTPDHTTDTIGLTAHGLAIGDRVRFAATTMPTGLTAGVWYYVVFPSTNEFQVSATDGGAAIDFSSNGTSVTIDSSAPYGTDLVDALADIDIVTSSEQTGYEGNKVKSTYGTGWRFSNDPSNPTYSTNVLAPWVNIDLGPGGYALTHWKFYGDVQGGADWTSPRIYTILYSDDALNYVQVFSGLGRTVLSYIHEVTITVGAHRYWRVQIEREDGSSMLGSVIGYIRAFADFGGYGTDRIDARPNSSFTASDELTGNECYNIKLSNYPTTWKANSTGITSEDLNRYDWGNNLHGYWQIPDAQAGLANVALKPHLTFDFGTARQIKVWRIKNLPGVERQDIVRVLQFHSSANSDMSSSTHEGNIEVRPVAGGWTDVLLHGAQSARYWRMCVRNTWAEALNFKMMAEVRAHTAGRNYWHNGRITFAADTATAALQGVSRRVLASYSGAVDIEALPVAPAAGDRFVIERGCGRTFNECCARRNEENFGGFTTLPGETVFRA